MQIKDQEFASFSSEKIKLVFLELAQAPWAKGTESRRTLSICSVEVSSMKILCRDEATT